MKTFTKDDIPIIKWEPHVRKHPTMYFGKENVTPEAIAGAIKISALLLGGKNVKFKTLQEWSYFCCDIDWLFNSTFPIKSVSHVFENPYPFPEANETNAYRYEALCLPFSSDAFTISKNETVLLKGALPKQEKIKEHLLTIGSWERVVAFKFDSTLLEYET